jgi:chromosome segregation ATPase
MDLNEQNNYNLLYAQRLENLLHDQIRKTTDVEVRLSLCWEKIEKDNKQIEELTKNVEVQADLIKQATNSVEALTLQNKNYSNDLSNANARINDLESKINIAADQQKDLQASNNQKDARISGLERELSNAKQESKNIYDELTELKNEKTINKKSA